MKKVTLECIKSTPSKNGGFITKLQTKTENSVDTAFGAIVSNTQLTYYVKTATQVEVGKKAELDLSQFDMVERDYVVDDITSDLNGNTITCKWLYPAGSVPTDESPVGASATNTAQTV